MIELATAPSYPLAPEDASQLVRASIGLDLPLPEPRVAGPARVYAHDPSLDTLAEPCALAIGAFDGVHVGHRSLIERTVADARARGIRSCVAMFDPDPLDVIAPGTPNVRLLSCADRIRRLLALGVDAVVAFTFDNDLRGMDHRAFCTEVLCRAVKPATVHVGADFHLGRGRGGNVEALAKVGAELGFEVYGEELLGEDGATVSATRIRNMLRASELSSANRLLGRCHFVRGVVQHGRGEGTGFGFPTANVRAAIEDCMPEEGVYACYVRVGDRAWPAATNVGAPPSFSEPIPAFLEANLIGFSGDIYGATVEVVFVEWLRASRKFDSFEELERTVMGNIHWTEENLGTGGVEV